jgi:Transposase and inactivated derivatives
MSRSKLSVQEKVDLILEFKKSHSSLRAFAIKNNVDQKTFCRWIRFFDRDGIDGLKERTRKRKYSYEFKLQVIRDYLEGKGSFGTLAVKYNLRTAAQVSDWLFKYNNGKLLANSSSRKKESIMTSKTTFEKRIEIVEYVVKDKHSYNEAAERFSVSYQQVRSWVLKANSNGYEALRDGRGHRKADEDLTDLDKANLKIRQLESQLKDQKVIEEFVKKLQELQHKG